MSKKLRLVVSAAPLVVLLAWVSACAGADKNSSATSDVAASKSDGDALGVDGGFGQPDATLTDVGTKDGGVSAAADSGSAGDSDSAVTADASFDDVQITECTSEGAGGITVPDDGADVSTAAFAVEANLTDEDGIVKVTVAVDTLQDCKFSYEPDGSPTNVAAKIDVDLATCGVTDGAHQLGLWAKDACGNVALLDSIWVNVGSGGSSTCSLDSIPPILVWQSEYTPATNCTCEAANSTCHAVYVGVVDEIVGNTATLRYRKVGGGLPVVPVSYWVVVLGEEQLDCNLLDVYVVRASGVWNPADGELVVAVDVWPDAAACDDAPPGGVKRLGLITGGSDDTGAKRWFSKVPLTFTKVVPAGGCDPSVTAVTPLSAKLNVPAAFVISGECLPTSLAAWIGDCEDLAFSKRTDTEAAFACTPSWSAGLKDGVVKDKTAGSVLHEFKLNVTE